jgi:uncharacterized membrane protein required for colicin V production
MLGVLVLVFAVRGLFRGSVWQVFALLGLAAGIWTAVLVSQWVGAHWQGARPAVVFLVLRWLVAGLAALAVNSLVVWWGEMLAGAVKDSSVGWLDRAMGFLVGATFGASVAALILLAAIRVPWPAQPREWVTAARVSPPVFAGAVRACELGNRYLPGSDWLKTQFQAAAHELRASVRPS